MTSFRIVAILLLLGSVACAEELPVLGSAAELDAFFEDGTILHQPCRIHGILQRKVHRPSLWELTVKESTGRHVAFATNVDWPLSAGDEVVIDGHAAIFSNLETYLTATNVTVTGRKAVDSPLEIRLSDLNDRSHDLREVIVNGTIVAMSDDEIDPNYGILRLRDDNRQLPVYFKKDAFDVPLDQRALIESRVRVHGVFHRTVSGERKFFGPYLFLEKPEDLHLVSPAPADPFVAPVLNDRLYLSPSEILRLGHRRTSGRVLARWGGDTFLLRTSNGLLVTVELREDVHALPPVDTMITAVGYPDTDRFHLILTHAIFKADPNPASANADIPENLCADTILKSHSGQAFITSRYHGRLISLYGTLRSVPSPSSPSLRAIVESKDFNIPVELADAPDAFKDVEIGSWIRVTGRCIVETENWSTFNTYPKAKGFVLVIRSAADVTVIERPSWWTPGRLLMVIGILLATLIGLFIRNRIQKRHSLLKIEDRTRLAVELHDSISQNLTGASLQIDAVGELIDTDRAKALSRLDIASKTLVSCHQELRNCIWDLRNNALDEKDMATAIRRTVEQHIGDAELFVRFSVPRDRLSDNSLHATLRIIRELATNAARHGEATAIRIAGAIEEDRLLFSVTDDGVGFDPDNRPGITQGHFGLQGVEERVTELGGEMTVESEIGKGTRVAIWIRSRC